MKNVFNREHEKWIRPWNQKKFDDIYNRDERFFAIIIKGLISWLNRNIVLYDESINHFIFNTGSSYLYMESNGYEYNLSETTGEDTMYMKLPRCLIELADVNIPMEELTSPFSRGNYERRNGNLITGFNAEIRRLPIELTINLKYYLSNFNETIVLLQEIIDKLVFQRYFNVTYLGQVLQCSVEFPANMNPEINKIDMTSPEPNQRNITLDIKICTNYPLIDTRTEIPTDKVIVRFGQEIDLYLKGFKGDTVHKNDITTNEHDDFDSFQNDYENSVSNKSFKELLEEYVNEIDINKFIETFDINNDGLLDEHEIIDLLEKMKYEYIEDDSKYGKIEIHKTNTINDSSNQEENQNESSNSSENYQNENLDNNETGKEENNDNINIPKYIEKCHYYINYKDIYYLIKIINKQNLISAHYDKFTNKIYVTHNDTGDTAEIDMLKYKINN